VLAGVLSGDATRWWACEMHIAAPVKAIDADAEKANVNHSATRHRGSFRSLALRIATAMAVVAAAVFAAFFAVVLDWLTCESGPSEACDRKDLARLQLQIAVAGLVPSLAFAFAWIGGWRRVAVATFILAVGAYLTWAVVADAAVHGWGDLKFFPF
jgi:hypothetical protein